MSVKEGRKKEGGNKRGEERRREERNDGVGGGAFKCPLN